MRTCSNIDGHTVLVEQPTRFCLAGGQPLDLITSAPETVDVLCALALFVQPRTIVEAGTYVGHTALALAAALQQRGAEFHLWTADPVDPYPSGFVTQAVAPLGLQEYVTFAQRDFLSMLHDVPGEIDLAYLDASATEQPEMRWEHYQAVRPRMRRGGLMMIDDCAGTWPHARELRVIADLYLPAHRGLAIIKA